MIDGVAGKLPINQAAKERHIVYYQLISVSHFQLVKALSHNFALSCKQTEVYYHANNNSTDAYGCNIFNNLRQKLQVGYRSKLEKISKSRDCFFSRGENTAFFMELGIEAESNERFTAPSSFDNRLGNNSVLWL